MDPLEEEICRLCFTDGNTLFHIQNDLEANVRDILSKHFGEVSFGDGMNCGEVDSFS